MLNPLNRIKVLRKNLKIKFYRGRQFKIFKNYTELIYLKSAYELQILDNIQKGDYFKGFEIKIPKRKIVDFEAFGGVQGKFCVITSDGGVFLYNNKGTLIIKLDLLTKKTEFFSTLAICPKSKVIAISTTDTFPSSKSSRENLYFLKLTGNTLSLINKIKVKSNIPSSIFYSLKFYPRYINGKPLLYGMENKGKRGICCYSIEEEEMKVNVLKIEFEEYHSNGVWGLRDDGESLWSIDDSWVMKNLIVEEV